MVLPWYSLLHLCWLLDFIERFLVWFCSATNAYDYFLCFQIKALWSRKSIVVKIYAAKRQFQALIGCTEIPHKYVQLPDPLSVFNFRVVGMEGRVWKWDYRQTAQGTLNWSRWLQMCWIITLKGNLSRSSQSNSQSLSHQKAEQKCKENQVIPSFQITGGTNQH